MTDPVTIVEMSPRDGLQNEKRAIPTADKIALIGKLNTCGFRKIEATSFVSPKWMPQLADAAEVMAGIERAEGVSYLVLTPNMKGFEAAMAARADEIAIFTAATEGFCKANINATIAESLERFEPLAEAAKAQGIPIRGYVSVVTDCPYDGSVDPGAVARVAEKLFAMGCYEVSLGDTTGFATPETTDAMLNAVLGIAPPERLAGHFHDTKGRSLENIGVSLARDLRVFDACVGGLGGCPYSPGAQGNVATEAVLTYLAANGFETGIDTGRVKDAARFARALVGKAPV